MKTLLNTNKKILTEYIAWENANKGNWNILSYLNQFYDLNAAIAFSKLFFPDFIERDGCIILEIRYDEKIFNDWYKKFNGNCSKIEHQCNLYEVGDFFHINQSFSSEEIYDESVRELSKILKKSWEINCQLLFTNKKIIVDVFDQYNRTYITLFSE
jgi:hypothetical protein